MSTLLGRIGAGIFAILAPTLLHAQTAGDFRSAATGAWNDPFVWERYNGSAWVSAPAAPASGDNVVTIRTPHTVTVTAPVTADQVGVDSGAALAVAPGITLTLNNGAGTDLTVSGTFTNTGTVAGTGTISFTAGGLYRHAHTTTAGTIPAATWDVASTCEIAGFTTNTSAPSGLGQSFGHFTWNAESQTGIISLGGALLTVTGNLTITNTGTGVVRFGTTSSATASVGGLFRVTGGVFVLTGTTGNPVLNVAGTAEISGGTLRMSEGTGVGTLNLSGDALFTGGTITETSTGSGTVRFVRSGTQAFVGGSAIQNTVNFTVNSGSVLNLGTQALSGGGSFTLASGGGLIIGAADGIAASGATGNIQVTGSRSFSTGGDYTYAGTVPQSAGSGLPTTLRTLVLDNPAGLTLQAAHTVSGDIILTQGTLSTGGLNLSTGGNWMNNGGALSAGGASVTFTGSGKTIGGSATTAFPQLTIAPGAAVSLATAAACTGLSFPAGSTASSLTHGAGVSLLVNGAVTVSQPTAGVTASWNINQGSATVSGNVALGGTNTTTTRIARIAVTTGTFFVGGTLTFNSPATTAANAVVDMSTGGGTGTLLLGGALVLTNGTGTLLPGTAGSVVNYAGASAGQTIVASSAVNYRNLYVNSTGTGGATLGGALSAARLTGDLRVQSGALSTGGFQITGNAGGVFEVADGAAFIMTGASGMPSGFGTRAFGPASSVEYAGSGAQTVIADSYGNLAVTGARGASAVTLEGSGIIRVAGTFTPAATFTTGGYVATGSTVEYAAPGSQTVVAFAYNNLAVTGARGSGIVTFPAGGTIGIGGAFTPSATFSTGAYITTGSTLEFNGSSQTIPVFPYHHLSTTGSGTKTAAGGLTLQGNLTVGPATSLALGSSTHLLRGDLAQNGSLDPGTATLELAGPAPQTLSGNPFALAGLRVNSAGVTLAGVDLTADVLLTLQSGTVTTGPATLTIGPGGTVSRTGGHIIGNLRKTVAPGTTLQTFEIGDASTYTPVTLSFTGVSAGGTLTVRTDPGDHSAIATSGIRPNRSVNRTYTLSGAGVAFSSYSATFTFAPSDLDPGAVPGSFVVRRYSTPGWFQSPVGTRTSTSTQTTGVTGFGAFQIGEGGAAFPGTSLVDAAPSSITADGVSSSTVTVSLRDDQGIPLTTGGDIVTVSADIGSAGAVTDNGNGTYTASFTSTTSGTAVIRATVNTGLITDSAVVTVVPGPVSLLASTLSAFPATIIGNGSTTSIITVQLRDAFGNNRTAGGGSVALTTTRGTLSAVTDSGNGRYGAVLTSAAVVDTARVTGTLNGSPFADDARVAFVEGLPTHLAWIREPRDTTAGALLRSAGGAPAVEVRDASGFRVQNATNSVTVAFAANPTGGTLGGTLTRSAVEGLAVFDDLFITKTGSGYALRTSSTGLTGDTSAFFTIRPAAAAALSFSQQPTTTVTGQIITPAVRVGTVDPHGNPTMTPGIMVTLTLTSGTGSLTGTLSATTDSSGTARFSDLRIDSLGSKRITASAAGLAGVQSSSFSIVLPPSVLLSDDFNSYDLAPFWTFVNPLGDASVSLTGTNTPNAAVTMPVPGGVSHDASTEGLRVPRIMQAANNTDFEVEAKFLSGVSLRYQLQGIIVEQDSLNFLRFDFHSDGGGTRVFASKVASGVQTVMANFSIGTNGLAPLFMKVRRVGDSWSQFYSLNGTGWNPTGTFSHQISVERVGLFAGNTAVTPPPPPPAHTGVFDYFFNTATPIVPEDGGTAVDSIPPVITGLAVAATDSSATFTWTTSELSTSSVAYGLTPSFELGTVTDTTKRTNHSLGISGLAPQRVYHFRVSSTDLRGNTGTGPDSTFATPDSSVIISDDFNTYTLKSHWTFVNPLADAGLFFVGQNTPDAWARITVPAGTVHQPWTGGNIAPRLMQSANNRDFTIEAKFESPLTQAFQMQGLLVEQDSANFVRFDVNTDGVGTRVFGGAVINGTGTAYVNTQIAAPGAAPQFVRISRGGTTWTLSFSFDGTTWTAAGSFSQTLTVRQVGPYAGNAGTSPPAHICFIDYFFNGASPVVPEDGGSAGGNTPPAISGVQVLPTGTTATVSWTTDEPATGLVRFGATSAYEGGGVGDTVLRTSHTFTIRSLQPASLVHFQVRAADVYGDSTVTADSTVMTGPASTIRSDDFNAYVLDTLVWRRINPRGDGTLSMTHTNTDSARVVLTVPAGLSHEPWTGSNTAQRIMQAANNADFEAEVKFESPLTQRFQLQGIIVEQSGAEYVRFDLNSDGTATKAFAATIAGGVPTGRHNVTIGTNGAVPQYMRVKREGNLWTHSTSFDGIVWTTAGSFTHPLVMDSIGVFAGNTGTSIPAHAARVDYFFNTRSPVVPEDGGIAPDPFPPVISGLLATPAATSATITWTTNEPATSFVSYGLTSSYELGTVGDPARTTSHTVVLTGLTPVTAYRFRVQSSDSTGNTAFSADSGFTTLSASTFISDDFNEPALGGSWTFVNPLGDGSVSLLHSYTDSAWVVISVPGGVAHDIWTSGRNAPRLMQTTNNVDMELEVKFESPVTQRYQMQGVIVEQDSGQFIRFDLNSDGSTTRAFAATFVGGTPTTRVNLTVGANGVSPQWIRVRRQGNQWTYRTSFNGTTWSTAGTFTFGMTVTAAGIFAGNTGTTIPAHAARIDYVFNTSFPIIPEDPIPDLTPPTVSGLGAVPDTTEIAFTWSTDEPSRGTVRYGLTPSLELGSRTDSTLSLAHAVSITGLTPGTLYYYRIDATDTAANTASSAVGTVMTTLPWVETPLRVFLAGPYEPAGDTMKTTLRMQGSLPLSQPYGGPPWNYSQGSETVDSIPPGVVDWVLVELRWELDSTATAARRAGFVRFDGSIVDTDGVNPLKLYGVHPGMYWIVVRHRNHVPVMSGQTAPMTLSGTLFDFTEAMTNAFGAAPMSQLEPGVFGLRSGDGNADGGVDVLDRNLVWRPQNGTAWTYGKRGDFNLDGGIDAVDLNLYWRPNNGTGTGVPDPPPLNDGATPR